MKILKIEDHNYQIIYINDNENYNVYKRINETKWEKFYRNEWKSIDDYIELEKAFIDSSENY
jgi:hypothetical protein